MFNFFNNKTDMINNESQPNDEDRIIATITYYVMDNEDDIKIDVGIKDYTSKSIMNLCDILDVLSQDKAYIETVNMITNSLEQKGDEKLLMQFLMHIGKQANKSFVNKVEEMIANQPCIRPSDMLQ